MKILITEEQYAFMRKMGFEMSDYVTASEHDGCPECTCRGCEICRKEV